MMSNKCGKNVRAGKKNLEIEERRGGLSSSDSILLMGGKDEIKHGENIGETRRQAEKGS